jgi:hypothetical protein
MAVIQVPKPPKEAMNPDRRVSTLLKAQLLHFQEVDKNLPPRLRTKTYVHAIKTERQAADYIRQVTQAVFKAHAGDRPKPRRRTRKATAPAAPAGGGPSQQQGGAEPAGPLPGSEQI